MSVLILIRENKERFSYQTIFKSGEMPKSYFGSKLGLSSNLKLFDRACHQMRSPTTVPNFVNVSYSRIGRSVCPQSQIILKHDMKNITVTLFPRATSVMNNE